MQIRYGPNILKKNTLEVRKFIRKKVIVFKRNNMIK